MHSAYYKALGIVCLWCAGGLFLSGLVLYFLPAELIKRLPVDPRPALMGFGLIESLLGLGLIIRYRMVPLPSTRIPSAPSRRQIAWRLVYFGISWFNVGGLGTAMHIDFGIPFMIIGVLLLSAGLLLDRLSNTARNL